MRPSVIPSFRHSVIPTIPLSHCICVCVSIGGNVDAQTQKVEMNVVCLGLIGGSVDTQTQKVVMNVVCLGLIGGFVDT